MAIWPLSTANSVDLRLEGGAAPSLFEINEEA